MGAYKICMIKMKYSNKPLKAYPVPYLCYNTRNAGL